MNCIPRSSARPIKDLQLCVPIHSSLRHWFLLTPIATFCAKYDSHPSACTELPTKMSKTINGWFPHPLLRIQVNVENHQRNGITHPAGCGRPRVYSYGSWHVPNMVGMVVCALRVGSGAGTAWADIMDANRTSVMEKFILGAQREKRGSGGVGCPSMESLCLYHVRRH